MSEEKITSYGREEWDHETQKYKQSKPEWKETILNQDTCNCQVQKKIRLAICNLSIFGLSLCSSSYLTIKDICDYSTKKNQQQQPGGCVDSANTSNQQIGS